jgi:hypothetical protein
MGVRIEDGLAQLAQAIPLAIEESGCKSGDEFETFAVVMVGTDIAFFEYHNDVSNLDEEGIEHFKGCVSLTQPHKVGGQMKEAFTKNQTPKNLRTLFVDSKRLKVLNDTTKQKTREEAKDYKFPCVFSIMEHQTEIHAMFQYMTLNKPRSSV